VKPIPFTDGVRFVFSELSVVASRDLRSFNNPTSLLVLGLWVQPY